MKKTVCWHLGLLVLAVSSLTGCGLLRSGDKQTATPPTATAPPTAIGTSPGLPLPGTTPLAPVNDTSLTLVMWTTEDYAPNSETGGGLQLMEQIQTFKQEREVNIDVILKKRSSAGGLLDFLTTASVAAPSVLPDLVTLSASDLYRAAQAGLLQPLDGLLSPQLLDDQFDFATELTHVQGATMGVLYQADLQHLVYDSTVIAQAPRSWNDLYDSGASFVFASGAGMNDVILIQYLSLGGKLVNESGQPSLDIEQLTQALEFFQQALDKGIIPPAVLDLTDASIAWAIYRIGEAGMAQVPASIYLADRAGLSSAGFGPVPLQITGTTTVGNGWVLAIVTQDPERQRMTAELIEHLLSPENNGAWTLKTGRLPARYASLQAWDENDPYLPFIRDLLAQASPAPNPDLAAAIGAPLAEALAQVLNKQATPADAAQTAVEAVLAGQE
jgi:ABC-type glycerol-3-phosphate transport system substrate-binding protein